MVGVCHSVTLGNAGLLLCNSGDVVQCSDAGGGRNGGFFWFCVRGAAIMLLLLRQCRLMVNDKLQVSEP